MEPSVEPLSATTTSPRRPAARNALIALLIQNASEFASFRQGITTDTSKAADDVGDGELSWFGSGDVASIFIDGSSVYFSAKFFDFCPIDWRKLPRAGR